MKLQEIYEDIEQLDEGLLQRAIAAAALVAGSLGTMQTAHTPDLSPELKAAQVQQALGQRKGAEIDRLAAAAASKYRTDPEVVKEIVITAHKYADPVFPTAKDILAVIGVESSFNPNAVSQLKRDPARGLMQVRPGVWDVPPETLNTIDGQIKTGVDILKKYFKKFKSKEAALHAYNVGETTHRAARKDPSKGNPRYVPKVNKERTLYASNAETTPAPAR